jgi:hypothetical protein
MSCPVRQSFAPPQQTPLPALALPPSQAGRLLAALLPGLAEGRRCYCLDGGNCFNPYELAAQARRQGLAPTPLLERLFVSRAYTCHQLLEAATTMLAPLAARPEPPLAMILGLDRLFLDDDIGLEERRRIFSRLLARVGELIGRGLPLLLTVMNAECGMRNAECKNFYEPFQIRTTENLLPQLPHLFNPQSALEPGAGVADEDVRAPGFIPHSTFRIPHFEAAR